VKRANLAIFSLIYIIGFAIVFGYGITHQPVNDGVKEYAEFTNNIQNGWHFRYSLVNSCLVTTWLPAVIQKITHCDPMFIFRIIPALFYPLMPAFTYLIARRYIKTTFALVAVLLVFLNSHFAYFPDIGRVGVSLGFMAGMIWALLEKKLSWAIIFSVLLVFSHYATSLIAISLVGFVWIGNLVWNLKNLPKYAIVFGVLVVLTFVWHFGIADYSGKIMGQTLFQTEQVGQILPVNPDFMDISTREPAIQAAFNINNTMPIPQRLEIIINWIVVGVYSLGLIFILRKKEMEIEYKMMCLALYGLIIFTVAVPSLSTYYGGMRIYFTSTIVLATGFILASEKIAKIFHTNPLIISGIILLLYGISTTGLIYYPFGLEKTFPVMETLGAVK